MQHRDFLYETSCLYNTGNLKIQKVIDSSKKNLNNNKYDGQNTSRIINKNFIGEGFNKSINKYKSSALSKSFDQFPLNKSLNLIKPDDNAKQEKYNFNPTEEDNHQHDNHENSNSNHLINYNTNYSNNISNINGNYSTNDYSKLNNLKNFDHKSKNNLASNSRNFINIKDRNYNNISNLLNVSTSNKYLKSTNFDASLNITNYSRAKSIGAKDIKRFNTFVNIEDALFKLKPEKSFERKNMRLNEKENDTVFNTSMNGTLFTLFYFIICFIKFLNTNN